MSVDLSQLSNLVAWLMLINIHGGDYSQNRIRSRSKKQLDIVLTLRWQIKARRSLIKIAFHIVCLMLPDRINLIPRAYASAEIKDIKIKMTPHRHW